MLKKWNETQNLFKTKTTTRSKYTCIFFSMCEFQFQESVAGGTELAFPNQNQNKKKWKN